jgi:F-box and WD-40 domain protein CDC4
VLTQQTQVLDFGASRDGVSESHRGRRIVVNTHGTEIEDVDAIAAAGAADAADAADD